MTGGSAEEGWGGVADAFRAALASQGGGGAAVAIHHEGRLVVDLWGGEGWDRDTVCVVMSCTKAATALCALRLVERGELDLEAPVAAYWPEFGKRDIRVRWLLTHQAGLPYVDAALTLEEACAWTPVVEALERQPPAWEPGTRYAYHSMTFGFLVGEVVRRITGRTVGRMFAEEVAGPLGLDAWIGLPTEAEPRVVPLRLSPAPLRPAVAEAVESLKGPGSVWGRARSLGGSEPMSTDAVNSPLVLRAELPAANLVTDARSLSRMYAATIAELDGVRLLGDDLLDVAAVSHTEDTPPFGLPGGLERFAMHFGLGFIPSYRGMPLLGPRSFGHPGSGGSLGFADRDAGIAFAFTTNELDRGVGLDRRTRRLITEVRRLL